MKRNYEILSLDAWGNDIEGFEVNQSYSTGIIVRIADTDKESDILAKVKNAYFAENVSVDSLEVTENSFEISIASKKSGQPLLQLRLVD